MRSSLSYDKVNSYPSASSYHPDVLCTAAIFAAVFS